MIAVWGCFGALLLHLFDRFERRFAYDCRIGDLIPARWLVWGRLMGDRQFPNGRYFVLRLPSYGWEFSYAHNEYRMGQRALVYTTRPGWRIQHLFN